MFDYLHCKYEPYTAIDESLIEKYGLKYNMDFCYECDSKIYIGGWVYSTIHQVQCVCLKVRKGRLVVHEQLQYAIERLDVLESTGELRTQKSGFRGSHERQKKEILQLEVIVDDKEVVLFQIDSWDTKVEHEGIEDVCSNYLYDMHTSAVNRKYIKQLARKIKQTRGLIVFFNHDLGGGADSYLKDKIRNEKIQSWVVIKYNLYSKRYSLEYFDGDELFGVSFWNFDFIVKLLEKANIAEIWVNNVYTYPNIYTLLEKILILRKKTKAKLIYPLHDYYEISPEKNLLSLDGIYRGIDKTDLNSVPGMENVQLDIGQWRKNWKNFLRECDEVRCFSQASKELLEEAYGTVLMTSLMPHSMDYFDEIMDGRAIEHHIHQHGENIHVGILGVLTVAKGLHIVEAMLDKIEKEELPIDITLIGNAGVKINSCRFTQTGAYEIRELPDIAEKAQIDVFLIPSVWPETFSYTTGEVMAMGYPIVVFDMGAPAERVRKYEKGYVVKEVSADAVCEMLLNDVR